MKPTGKNLEQFNKWYLIKFLHLPNPCEQGVFDSELERFYNTYPSMQQGVYLEFIREERGVLIQVYNNASGYLWQMSKMLTGTDLGWSGLMVGYGRGGSFDTYNGALTNAIELEFNGGLSDFEKTRENKPFHWGNYACWLKGLSK